MTNRDYTSLPVKEATDEELLLELLSRNNLSECSRKKEFYTSHTEAIIGIGNDDVAYIQLDNDSLKVLQDRVAENNPGIE